MPPLSDIALTPSQAADLKWWGEYQFDIGQSRAWLLGSLLLRLTRGVNEWQLEYHRPRHQDENDQDWQLLSPEEDFGQKTTLERYLFAHTGDRLTLLPRLADRSVVVKPVNPIYIPAGQQGTMFISTPLWVAAYIPEQKAPLFDTPILRPNDTWFGPNTLRGEVCYATPVFCRTELAHLPPRPFRAVTPVHFHNNGTNQLELARINLPVPALPLFHSADTGRLWTSPIDVLHDATARPPRIRIDHHTPTQAGEVSFIGAPRHDGGLLRMFDTWFD
ncbi:MAG: hypothetical protein RLY58_2011 [Pseudomonadota bacterium]|jgi:hypothetical protein